MTVVAGIDIGGTKTLAVATDGSGATIATVRSATRAGDPATVASHAAATVTHLARAAGVPVAELAAIGVGLPGMVDGSAGEVRHAVNLGIDGHPLLLGDHLRTAVGVPTLVANDVDAAAVGAVHLLGTAADLAYLSIGTGVAAGLVLGGQLRRGHRDAAGEIGHLVVDPNGPRCRCGQRGCLEALVAGPAIAARWPAPAGRAPAEHLVQAAAGGDAAAAQALAEVAAHIGAAVTVLGLTVDPATIVLGGGVAEAGEPLVRAVRDALASRAAGVPLLEALDLAARVTLLAVDAAPGALGAALLARSALVPAGH